MTSLQRACRGLMEACWLAAVMVVPVAYNPQMLSGFQPFKTALLRLFAMILMGAMLVDVVEGRERAPAGRPRG